jgi:hypothetical protein
MPVLGSDYCDYFYYWFSSLVKINFQLMWILPKNLPLYSRYAQGCVDSNEDLKSLLESFGEYTTQKKMKDGSIIEKTLSELPLFWRSNHLPRSTWYAKWKKVWWLPLLFGRTLKHSHTNSFATEYASSLEVIPVNPFHKLESSEASMIRGTSSHSSNEESSQLGLLFATSKTSPTTSTKDTIKSGIPYKKLVTQLKREYSLRVRWARLILGSVYSSSQWPTPTAQNRVRNEATLQKCLDFRKRNANQNSVPLYLEETVRNWATPMSRDHKGQTSWENQPCLPNQVQQWATPTVKGNNNQNGISEKAGDGLTTQAKMWTTPLVGATDRKTQFAQGGTALPVQVRQWTTPSTRDWKDTSGMVMQRSDGKSRLDQLPRQVFGLQDKDESNTDGKNLVLNPGWVLQLMGLTLQKTFFVWPEMESFPSNPPSHS